MKIRPVFVTRVPAELEQGVLYISEKYATAVHSCICGCGSKIVTPLKPGQWTLTRDGDKVTLSPSVGGWSSTCQSHYWIEGNEVIWSRPYSKGEIQINRARDSRALDRALKRRRGFWVRLAESPWTTLSDLWRRDG